jgi:hypothetical protein
MDAVSPPLERPHRRRGGVEVRAQLAQVGREVRDVARAQRAPGVAQVDRVEGVPGPHDGAGQMVLEEVVVVPVDVQHDGARLLRPVHRAHERRVTHRTLLERRAQQHVGIPLEALRDGGRIRVRAGKGGCDVGHLRIVTRRVLSRGGPFRQTARS